MKNLKLLAFLCVLCGSFSYAFAQQKPIPEFDGFHKNFTVELLGSHFVIGGNFDMRLRRGRMDGIGFRAGIGGFNASGNDGRNNVDIGVATFPLEVNYVTGKRRGGFVVGAGLLPMYASAEVQGEITDYEFVQGEGFDLVGGFITAGYRLQPLRNGFTMQINWNPMVLRGSGFNAGWLGISLGVGFK